MTSVGAIAIGDLIQSGPLSVRVAPDLSLRDVTVAGRRALDGVLFSVRDALWGTGETIVEHFEGSLTDDGFSIRFRCRHRSPTIDIEWRGSYVASAGVLTAALEGRPAKQQSANRAGFTVLHPIELVGRRVDVVSTTESVSSFFPTRIDPNILFTRVTSMREDLGAGCSLSIEFDGDVFETEDHRNWTDAGWKTYCTPLSDPAPRVLAVGDVVRQSIVLTASAPLSESFPREGASVAEIVAVSLRAPEGDRLPTIGSGTSGRAWLSAEEVEAVRALGLGFLHVELVDGDDEEEQWRRACTEAEALDATLRVALVTDGCGLKRWEAKLAASAVPIESISVFDRATNSSSKEHLAELMRWNASPSGVDAPAIGAGTRGYFAELNRLGAKLEAADHLEYSVSPQVHHSDDELVLDTLLAQPDTLRDALILAVGRPVSVGPITLKQRLNVHEVPAQPLNDSESAGPDVDVRQHDDFTGVWSLGTIASLRRASSITLFCTCGLRGIVPAARDSGERPPVTAAQRVISALARCAGSPIVPLEITDPRRLVGLACIGPDAGIRLWLGNRTRSRLDCSVVAGTAETKLSLAPYEVVEMAFPEGTEPSSAVH